MKVLISDNLSARGVEILKKAGLEVDARSKTSVEEIEKIIGEYDALIIRSATKVTAGLLEKAAKLKVVGRAGSGLDNVDIPASTKKGVVVMNTPGGNTVTTAEHTIGMIFACARMIPQAYSSLKAGKWEKKKFEGVELFDKTLGIVGLGAIGGVVANRCSALGMKILAFDPFKRRDGALFALFLTIYPVNRFLMECIRTDEPGIWGTPLTGAQFLSLALLAGVCVLWWHILRRPPGKVFPAEAA